MLNKSGTSLKYLRNAMKNLRSIRRITEVMDAISASNLSNIGRRTESSHLPYHILHDSLQTLLHESHMEIAKLPYAHNSRRLFNPQAEQTIDATPPPQSTSTDPGKTNPPTPSVANKTHANLEFKNYHFASLPPEKEVQDLIICFASERGLCGAFNNNITKAVNKLMAEMSEDTKIIAIGKKAYDGLNRSQQRSLWQYRNLTGLNSREFDFNVIYETVIHDLITIFSEYPIKNCKIVYTHFISSSKQEVRIVNLFPLQLNFVTVLHSKKTIEFSEANMSDIQSIHKPFHPEVEPGIYSTIKIMFSKYIAALLYHAILNSIHSEFAARMLAMYNANQNSKKFLENLSKAYNRRRQATVTKELIEIIAGAESAVS